MPLPGDIVVKANDGSLKWGEVVTGAVRALVGSTTPGRRYAIYRAGFFAFQQTMSITMRHRTEFLFGPVELRWMWAWFENQIAEDVRRHPALAADFENRRSAESQRRYTAGADHIILTDMDIDGGDPQIIVENRQGRVRR